MKIDAEKGLQYGDFPEFIRVLCGNGKEEDQKEEIKYYAADVVEIISGYIPSYLDERKPRRLVTVIVEFRITDDVTSSGRIWLAISDYLPRTIFRGGEVDMRWGKGEIPVPNDGVVIITIPSTLLCGIVNEKIDGGRAYHDGLYSVIGETEGFGLDAMPNIIEILIQHKNNLRRELY